MKRFYRIDYRNTPRHAVERDGEWRLVEGDTFDSFQPGARISIASQSRESAS